METMLEALIRGRRRREGNPEWPDDVKARSVSGSYDRMLR